MQGKADWTGSVWRLRSRVSAVAVGRGQRRVVGHHRAHLPRPRGGGDDGPLDRLPAGRQHLREPGLHAPGHVVLGVDLQGARSQRVGAVVIALGQRAACQPDHGDGVARVQLDHPLVHPSGPVDLVDLQVAVGLEDLLDHGTEPT